MTAVGAHPAAVPAARGRRPGTGTVYRWELRKLLAQKRTFLGLGAALVVPVIFVVALLADPGGGGPDEVAFGSFVRETGLAIPLVCLTFGSIWLIPLITALVAGDIVATEDQNGTLKTILTRSVERWHVIAGKALAALHLCDAVLVLYVGSGLLLGGLAFGFDPVTLLSGTQGEHRPRDRADRRRHARLPHAGARDRVDRAAAVGRSRATPPRRWSAC